MLKFAAILTLGLGIAFAIPERPREVFPLRLTAAGLAAAPLKLIPQAQIPQCLGLDEQWGQPGKSGDKTALLAAVDHSLRYLRTPAAREHYRKLSIPGITHNRVQRSLIRFRQLLVQAKSPAELQAAVRQEFNFYQSIGKDGQGAVDFTGYFEPTYAASRVPTSEYRYPLYRLPPRFKQWSHPHPTRTQLEGADGREGSKGPLKGLELVWLRDRLEAFLIQVQGSARLQLTDGSVMTVGFAGKTDQPYSGIGKELVKDGKFRLEELSLPTLVQYFRQHPEEMNRYLPRNHSFVFFRETNGAAATGSLSVPVTAERSVATDKSLLPPGALALIDTQIPYHSTSGQLQLRQVNRYVLDQDTGSAIKGPGRVDIFMGTGPLASERAGHLISTGQLYYLLLK